MQVVKKSIGIVGILILLGLGSATVLLSSPSTTEVQTLIEEESERLMQKQEQTQKEQFKEYSGLSSPACPSSQAVALQNYSLSHPDPLSFQLSLLKDTKQEFRVVLGKNSMLKPWTYPWKDNQTNLPSQPLVIVDIRFVDSLLIIQETEIPALWTSQKDAETRLNY